MRRDLCVASVVAVVLRWLTSPVLATDAKNYVKEATVSGN